VTRQRRIGSAHVDIRSADPRLPLSALVSQVLVAFTIELDNEFELRMPHRRRVSRRELTVATLPGSAAPAAPARAVEQASRKGHGRQPVGGRAREVSRFQVGDQRLELFALRFGQVSAAAVADPDELH
jgi:hypothetical protein